MKYIEVQWQTQQLANIPDHKNFYKPLHTVIPLPDWKYYKNGMVWSIHQASEVR